MAVIRSRHRISGAIIAIADVSEGKSADYDGNDRAMQSSRDLVRPSLGNWLVCVVCNHLAASPDRYTFTTEPKGGGADGAICDQTTGLALATEHVMVAKRHDGQCPEESAEQLVLAQIEKKLAKGGAAYASGKVLVVYLDADVAGYSPRALREQLPADLAFADVWVVVPQGSRWDYDVVYLGGTALDPPTCRVTITDAFDDRKVERISWPPANSG